jgi:alginate O-acetyltransferase complex protein AlgI
MLFNSLQFLVFFAVITSAYYLLKNQSARVWLLLIASCYFYMSFVPKYILILGATIVIDYFAGIQIARSEGAKRKTWLILSLVANIGILAFYKYFNFLLDNFAMLMHFKFPEYKVEYLEILLPIGLSFHTFQAMSYTIEVYRGNYEPERNFVVYALYVMFYPQLVAGPIERPQNVLPQFHVYHHYNWDNMKEGLTRMLWGFFKKVVIADRVAMVVDHSYATMDVLTWKALAISAALYSFQIYCDFSGYSDIGIGAARVMGIRLMENFNQPYLSRNITTFWSRWHISLSTWFRDYLYIPLGGNRKGPIRRRFNVFIVFLLSGLWHGANWTFVVWGALHGVLVTFLPGKGKHETGVNNLIRTAFFIGVNFILVTILWVFFRAPNIATAVDYLSRIFKLQDGLSLFALNKVELILSALLIVFMLWKENKRPGHFIKSNPAFAVYFVMMTAACYFLGVFGENQFIYFQF